MRYPPLYRRNMELKEEKKVKKIKSIATLKEEKIVRWAVDDKENWRREEKVKVDYRKIKEMVLQKFQR